MRLLNYLKKNCINLNKELKLLFIGNVEGAQEEWRKCAIKDEFSETGTVATKNEMRTVS